MTQTGIAEAPKSVDFLQALQGRILTFSAPSCAGKTTVMQILKDRYPDLNIIPSTVEERRGTRHNDLTGGYNLIPSEDFRDMQAAGKFLWAENIHGTWYGTLRENVDHALHLPTLSLMDVVPKVVPRLRQYVSAVKKKHGRLLHVFVHVESTDLLRKRIMARDRDRDASYYDRRITDCLEWKKAATNSGIGYLFLKNDGRSPEETVDELVQHLQRATRGRL